MLEPGHSIDNRYEIEALIGEGGLAQVYKVRHLQLGSVHALKLLSWQRKGLAKRMLLEGRIQAQLKHPNVVAVSDVINYKGQLGLLMEYVDHLPLPDLLERRGHLSTDEALELFAQILAGVNAAHQAGVLHRDLKPQNILLARSNQGLMPKVTDFGIAKVVQDEAADFQTMGGVPMGTPGYMAPEQVTDSASVDARADIFSLGVILFELLAGVPAFVDPDGQITVGTTLTCDPRPLEAHNPEAPDYVIAAYRRAVAREPDDRFDTCVALAEALLVNHPALLAVVAGEARSEPITLYPSGRTPVPSSGGARPTMDPGGAHTFPVPHTPAPKSPLDAPSIVDSPAMREAAAAAAKAQEGELPEGRRLPPGSYSNQPPPYPPPGGYPTGAYPTGGGWPHTDPVTGLPYTPANITPALTTQSPDAKTWGPVLLLAMIILLGAGLGGGYLLWGRPAPSTEPPDGPPALGSPDLTPVVEVTPPKDADPAPLSEAPPADAEETELTGDEAPPTPAPAAEAPSVAEAAPEPEPEAEAEAEAETETETEPDADPAPEAPPPEVTPEPSEPAVAEVEPPPPPVPVPSLKGSWIGATSTNTPMSLEVLSQDGERLTAEVTFRLGPTVRSAQLAGSIDPKSKRLFLIEADGDHLKLQGTMSDVNSIAGTYTSDGQRRTLEWSVNRKY